MRVTSIVCGLLLLTGALDAEEAKPEQRLMARLPLPFPNAQPKGELSEAEQKLVRESIRSFDSDHFKVRERAVEQIVELGPRALLFLGQIHPEISTSASFGPEVELRWEQVITAIRTREMSERYEATVAAIVEAKKNGVTRSASCSSAFMAKLRMPLKELTVTGDLNDVLAELERHTGIPMTVDPGCNANSASNDWKWEQQSTMNILADLCRQYEAVWRPYRDAVIIGSPDRIGELARCRLEVRLPAPRDSAEPPWSVQETRDWINALAPDSPQDEETRRLFLDPPPNGRPTARVHAPGLIEMEGDEFQVSSMLELVASNPQLTLCERLPEVRELVRILDAPMGERFSGKHAAQVIGKRFLGSPVSVGGNPFLNAAEAGPASCENAGQTFRAWLEMAAKENWCRPFPCILAGKPTVVESPEQDPPAFQAQLIVFFCVDLKEAQSKGVSHARLVDALRSIQRESPFPWTAQRIRDRWVGYADLWTVLRMEDFVASVGHNTEYLMPPPPELPWFMKELISRQ